MNPAHHCRNCGEALWLLTYLLLSDGAASSSVPRHWLATQISQKSYLAWYYTSQALIGVTVQSLEASHYELGNFHS